MNQQTPEKLSLFVLWLYILLTFFFFLLYFILFIAAGSATQWIALCLNLYYFILFILYISLLSPESWLKLRALLIEIRFQFHEFATRLKLSLLRLDTFIWFATASVSGACLSISRRRSQRRDVAAAVDVLPCQTDASMQWAAVWVWCLFLICFGEVCKQCLALADLMLNGIGLRGRGEEERLLQFAAKLTHGN